MFDNELETLKQDAEGLHKEILQAADKLEAEGVDGDNAEQLETQVKDLRQKYDDKIEKIKLRHGILQLRSDNGIGPGLEDLSTEIEQEAALSEDEVKSAMRDCKEFIGIKMLAGSKAGVVQKWVDNSKSKVRQIDRMTEIHRGMVQRSANAMLGRPGGVGVQEINQQALSTTGGAATGGFNTVAPLIMPDFYVQPAYYGSTRRAARIVTRPDLNEIRLNYMDRDPNTVAVVAEGDTLTTRARNSDGSDGPVIRGVNIRPQRMAVKELAVTVDLESATGVTGLVDTVFEKFAQEFGQMFENASTVAVTGSRIMPHSASPATLTGSRAFTGKTLAATIQEIGALLAALSIPYRRGAVALVNDDVINGWLSLSVGTNDRRVIDRIRVNPDDPTTYITREGYTIIPNNHLQGLTSGQMVASRNYVTLISPMDGYVVVDYAMGLETRRFEEKDDFAAGQMTLGARLWQGGAPVDRLGTAKWATSA